jgi:hypothetical protein
LLFCILVNAAHTTVTLLLDPSFVLADKLDMVNMFQNATDEQVHRMSQQLKHNLQRSKHYAVNHITPKEYLLTYETSGNSNLA